MDHRLYILYIFQLVVTYAVASIWESNEYWYSPTTSTYIAGKLICNQKVYASIVSEEENTHIHRNGRRNQYWIGMTTNEPGCDACKLGESEACNICRSKWFWMDGSPMHYTNWFSHEPSQQATCAYMTTSGQWASSLNCNSSTMYRPLCKNPTFTYLNGYEYWYSPSEGNYAYGNRICNQKSTASILSEEENIHVRKYYPGREYWIGLTTYGTGCDACSAGDSEACDTCRSRWSWMDGSPMIYTNWLPYEPAGKSTCGYLTESGQWANSPDCTTSQYYPLCKNPKRETTKNQPKSGKVRNASLGGGGAVFVVIIVVVAVARSRKDKPEAAQSSGTAVYAVQRIQ